MSFRRSAPGQTFGLESSRLGREVKGVGWGRGRWGPRAASKTTPSLSGLLHQLGLLPLLCYSPVITLNATSVVMTTYYPSLGKSPICRGVRLSPAPWAPSSSLQPPPPPQGSPAVPLSPSLPFCPFREVTPVFKISRIFLLLLFLVSLCDCGSHLSFLLPFSFLFPDPETLSWFLSVSLSLLVCVSLSLLLLPTLECSRDSRKRGTGGLLDGSAGASGSLWGCVPWA